MPRARKRKPAMLGPLRLAMQQFERSFLEEIISRHQGNLSHVAAELQMSVGAVRYRVFENDLVDFVCSVRRETRDTEPAPPGDECASL
jgi:DNA-binding NtrC family response regulator